MEGREQRLKQGNPSEAVMWLDKGHELKAKGEKVLAKRNHPRFLTQATVRVQWPVSETGSMQAEQDGVRARQ